MKQAASRAKSAADGIDPLAAVVSLLRPRTVLSKVISGAGRWSVRYEAHQHPGFCVMLEGSCILDVDGVGEIALEEGDFLLLPATPGFTMSSDRRVPAGRRARGDASHTGALRHGTPSGPPTMRQLGGYFHFDSTNAALVVRLLPSKIVVRRDEPGATRLRSLVERIGDEAMSDRLGRELVLERLVEVLLVEALRYQPAEETKKKRSDDGTHAGLLAGLRDPALARALRCMHEDVARRWTVADLARAAGMSRASFAERFARTVGVPPMEYLLEWRIATAKDLLRRGAASLTEVAEAIGYQSASAFSTAFSRHTGCAPSEFARAMRASRGG